MPSEAIHALRSGRSVAWRRRVAAVSAVLGAMLMLAAFWLYMRYAANPADPHIEERMQHAQVLGVIWSVGFYGPMLLAVLSLFGRGRWRLLGLAVNAGAFLLSLMILGAMCGPFMC